jgi:hypothetical protein
MEDERLNWHTAFYGAIQFELAEYKDALEFESEHELTSEPLRIDVLIVKKKRNIEIKKNIARIFRHINIVEYKSPDVSLDVNEFCKAFAYCYVYASIRNVPITDISLSIILSIEAKTVFKHIKDVYGWEIEEASIGIYIVSGAGMPFPIQIINSKKLSEEENLWLKDLRGNISLENFLTVLDKSKEIKDIVLLKTYLDILNRANPKTFEEARNMKYPTMDELLIKTGLAAEWERRGMEKANQQWENKSRQWEAERQQLQTQLQQFQSASGKRK